MNEFSEHGRLSQRSAYAIQSLLIAAFWFGIWRLFT
jgi:hypothetical protein